MKEREIVYLWEMGHYPYSKYIGCFQDELPPPHSTCGIEFRSGKRLPQNSKSLVIRFDKILTKEEEQKIQAYDTLWEICCIGPIIKSSLLDFIWDLIENDVQVFEPKLSIGNGNRIYGYKLLNIVRLVEGLSNNHSQEVGLVVKNENFMDNFHIARDKEKNTVIYVSQKLRDRLMKAKIKGLWLPTPKELWESVLKAPYPGVI